MSQRLQSLKRAKTQRGHGAAAAANAAGASPYDLWSCLPVAATAMGFGSAFSKGYCKGATTDARKVTGQHEGLLLEFRFQGLGFVVSRAIAVFFLLAVVV